MKSRILDKLFGKPVLELSSKMVTKTRKDGTTVVIITRQNPESFRKGRLSSVKE